MTSAISSPIRLSRRGKALLLSPIVILIAAATRLLLISNGDTTVASSIAAAGGVTGSLLGTVIPLLPPYLPLLALLFVLYRRIVLAFVVAAAAALVSPAYASASDGVNFALNSVPRLFGHLVDGEWAELWRAGPEVVSCVVLGIVFAFWGVSEVSSGNDTPFLAFVRQARFIGFGVICGTICMFGLLFTLAVYRVPFSADYASQIARRPWLPAEELRTVDGARYVGFVVSTKDGWFLVMNEADRSLRYLPAAAVVERVVCLPRSYEVEYRSPLIELRGAGEPAGRVCGQLPTR